MPLLRLKKTAHPEPQGEPEMENMPTPHAMRPPVPHPPIPPHERRSMFQCELEENDIEILRAVFHDDDTVSAAVEIINTAPPEIQVLAFQIIKLIETETKHEG